VRSILLLCIAHFLQTFSVLQNNALLTRVLIISCQSLSTSWRVQASRYPTWMMVWHPSSPLRLSLWTYCSAWERRSCPHAAPQARWSVCRSSSWSRVETTSWSTSRSLDRSSLAGLELFASGTLEAYSHGAGVTQRPSSTTRTWWWLFRELHRFVIPSAAFHSSLGKFE